MKILYVERKESGPLGGVSRARPRPDPPMYLELTLETITATLIINNDNDHAEDIHSGLDLTSVVTSVSYELVWLFFFFCFTMISVIKELVQRRYILLVANDVY